MGDLYLISFHFLSFISFCFGSGCSALRFLHCIRLDFEQLISYLKGLARRVSLNGPVPETPRSRLALRYFWTFDFMIFQFLVCLLFGIFMLCSRWRHPLRKYICIRIQNEIYITALGDAYSGRYTSHKFILPSSRIARALKG